MYCNIIVLKDGIPISVRIDGNNEYAFFSIKDCKVQVPLKDLQKVLDFFR